MDQNYILNNLRANTSRDSALETLMDFERVMDTANIYAYKNCWKAKLSKVHILIGTG